MTNPIRKAAAPTVLVAALAVLCAAPPLLAQPANEGPLVLRLPASARALSLGNVGVVSTDGDALFYNPGMLAQSRGSALSAQRYGDNAIAGAMATTTVSGSYTLGFGVQFVRYASMAGASYDDIVLPGATHLSDSGTVASTSTAITLGVAKTIKGFRLGASAKYVEDNIGLSHDGTLALDIGMNRPLGPGTLGFAVQNLGAGPRLNGIDGTLPRRITLGFGAYRAVTESWDLGAQGAVALEGDLFVRPAAGVEAAYVPIEGVAFTIRQGFRLPRETDESPFTAGFGLTVDRLSVDYAIEPMQAGRAAVHRLGLRVR